MIFIDPNQSHGCSQKYSHSTAGARWASVSSQSPSRFSQVTVNMLTALLIVSSGRTPVPELHVHPRHGLHPRLQPGLHDPELGRGGGGGGGQPALPGPAPAALDSRRRLGPSRPRSQGDCRTAVPGTGVAPYSCGCHTRG